MMQHAIDRSRQTGGSLAASTGLHVLGLLLLAFLVGREAAERWTGDELTEIAYIEARYGEDVAEKVKLKALKPEGLGGPGITTESAVKPRPEPAVAEAAVPDRSPEPVAAPTLEPRKQLAAPPKLEPQAAPVQKQQLAAAEVLDLAPTTVPAREMAQATQLEARTAPLPSKRVVDTEKLARSLAGDVTETVASLPRPATTAPKMEFAPQNSGLQNRGGRAPTGNEPVVAATTSTSRTGGAVAGAEAALAGGGLSQRDAAPAAAPSLQRPALARGSAGGGSGATIADVSGPAVGSGGGAQSGRKTILDYGEGNGGSGSGSLVGRRGRLAEPAARRDIVATAEAAASEPQPRVAEAKLDAEKGVGMTITGQIAGRKIVHRVAPQYSEQARRQGWEGAVAVHFTVLPDGRVKDNVYFEQTSVHRDLNQAAMAAIRQFRFAALPTSQAAVEQWGVITIVFRLN